LRTTLICCGVVLLGILALPDVPALGREAEVEKTAEWAEEGRQELSVFLGVSDKKATRGLAQGSTTGIA
jgi:hypothetical protein